MEAVATEKRLLTRREAAEYLCVSESHLRNLEHAGSGPPCLVIGRKVRRYPREGLERYLEGCLVVRSDESDEEGSE